MKTVAFGEIMLRLKSPGFERFLQSALLEATFGGSEANVAISLALFGEDAAFVTVLPDNPLTDACVRELRGFGVEVSGIVRAPGRMGLYFVEAGSNQRASRVVYDRADSSLAKADPDLIDWDAVLDGADRLHLTGITPAISASAAELNIRAARKAREKGIIVSLDFNLRMNLWKYGKKPSEVLPELVRHCDLLFASRDHFDIGLGIKDDAARGPETDEPDASGILELCQKVMDAYPNVKAIAMPLRRSLSADHNNISASYYDGKNFLTSRTYRIDDIVDRIGGGDAFTAGLLYGLDQGKTPQEALEFATASECLKHSIPGDINRITADEVEGLLASDGSVRIKR